MASPLERERFEFLGFLFVAWPAAGEKSAISWTGERRGKGKSRELKSGLAADVASF